MSTSFGSAVFFALGLCGLIVGGACVLRERRRLLVNRSREDALKVRESQAQVALQASKDGYWQWRADTQVLTLSPRVYELLGYDPADVRPTAAALRSMVHEEDYRSNRRPFVRHLLDCGMFKAQYRMRLKSGDYRWFGVRGQSTCDESGTLLSSGSFFDVTEHKRAEEISARHTLQQALTAELGQIGGWEQAIGEAVPQLSAMACRIHDLPPGSKPDEATWANFYPPESLKTVRRSTSESFELSKPFDYIVPFVTATGRLRWIRSIGEPQVTNGKCQRIVGAIQDVTQQKHLEAELAQAHKLESIGQLAAGIAHEINTPTQFIGNNLSFISDSVAEILAAVGKIRDAAAMDAGGTSPQALLATLQSIDLPYLIEEVPLAVKQSQEGVERIQRIVGAMKEFSHPAMDKTSMDINRAISSTIIVASNEWKYVAEVITDLDSSLPSVDLMPGSFNQVILNLIVNAAHAISEVVDGGARGKGTITVSTRRIDEWVEVAIRDTGGGIPEEIRARIFDPFFTTKGVGKGTGQGLAIAHDVVVNKHGGAIAVEANPGGGAAFILRLPLPPESANPEIAVGA